MQSDYHQLIYCGGEGGKDRSAILADALVAPLQHHLVTVKALQEFAIGQGFAGVELPFALERGYDMRKGANAVRRPPDR